MKRGFTLVELLIVITIVVIMVIIAVAGLNPTAQVNKGKDATRKKDLRRISIAFEEYYNDHGCYPPQTLIDSLGCQSSSFYQLNPWPCDPNGNRYVIKTGGPESCANWFTVVTRLETEGAKTVCNYGVSSLNKKWEEENDCATEELKPPVTTSTTTSTSCDYSQEECFAKFGGGMCNVLDHGCEGSNCFLDMYCLTPVPSSCSCVISP